MKVLFISCVGTFGGATRSLHELVSSLVTHFEVEPYFVFSKGNIRRYFCDLSDNIVVSRGLSRFYFSRYGFYKGWRWLILFRELFNLPFSLHALIKARNKFEDVDLIHVNEVSDIPLAILAKMIFKVPVVLHARSILVVECRSLRIKVLRYLIQRYIDKIIAIDSNVAATVPNVCQVEVINNSFTVDYSMNDVEERLIKRRSNDKPLIFGFVGNIIKSKGIFELVQACLMLKNDSKNFKLIVAGGSLRELGYFKKLLLGFTGINQDCLVAVNDFVTNNRLETVVEFKGHIDEIADFYKEVDVIMFPSSLDAPGRPIFEAGFFGVPSIACIRKTYPDTFMDGVTGIAIPHNHPTEIATAMNNFICNKELVGEMGLAVASMSRKFNDPTVNARKVSRIYEKLVIR